MWQEERYQRIRKMLAALRSASTDRIAEELGVSRETVRRDLIALEARGELRRTHGGAVLDGEAPEHDPTHHDRRHYRAVARAAASRLSNGQTLFMEAGSMAVTLAEALDVLHGITVITNSFDAAMRIAASRDHLSHGNRAVMLDGSVLPSLAATHGEHAIAEIHRYTADAALLCPSAIDARHGATHADLSRAELARAMAANARSIVAMADDTAIGQNAGVSYCPADRIAMLISNRKAEATEGYDALAGALGGVVLV